MASFDERSVEALEDELDRHLRKMGVDVEKEYPRRPPPDCSELLKSLNKLRMTAISSFENMNKHLVIAADSAVNETEYLAQSSCNEQMLEKAKLSETGILATSEISCEDFVPNKDLMWMLHDQLLTIMEAEGVNILKEGVMMKLSEYDPNAELPDISSIVPQLVKDLLEELWLKKKNMENIQLEEPGLGDDDILATSEISSDFTWTLHDELLMLVDDTEFNISKERQLPDFSSTVPRLVKNMLKKIWLDKRIKKMELETNWLEIPEKPPSRAEQQEYVQKLKLELEMAEEKLAKDDANTVAMKPCDSGVEAKNEKLRILLKDTGNKISRAQLRGSVSSRAEQLQQYRYLKEAHCNISKIAEILFQ